MSYGSIKVDTIVYTSGGSDATSSVSGLASLANAFSGNVANITVTGTISGATITGDTVQVDTLTGNTIRSTSVTGVSGVFTTQVSGATVTGNTGEFTTLTGGTAGFTAITGTTVTGDTANFVSGVFTTQVSGVTVIGTTVTGDAGNFTTATVTSGVFASGTAAAPSVSVGTTDNGIYSPNTDQIAISTNSSERIRIGASGEIGIGGANYGTSGQVLTSAGLGVAAFWQTQAGSNIIEEGNSSVEVIDTGSDGRVVFTTEGTERLRINASGAFGVDGTNYGTAGQVLVSNGSNTAPSWEQITPPTIFGWDHDDDTYGLYFPGTSTKVNDITGTVDISVQSRLRRCVINDAGVVQYYLDADDSTLKSGDWLRIVETQALDVAYTGTHSESTNSLLRDGVPAWSAGTYFQGRRVTYNGSLWECVAASTTATPAAGTVASDLSGADGQVMVEVPAFSVRYSYLNGVHLREVRLGCSDTLIAQGFHPHPAFVKTDGTYKNAFYIGAYQVTGTSPATTVSGANNRVDMTRATQRAASAARGTGWHILSYLEYAAIQTLMVTEFRDMNTQRAIGNGSQKGLIYSVNTGLSNAAGNRTQNDTSAGSVTDYISYRGLENIYGRAVQWVDGMNVYDRAAYLTNDQTAFADNTSTGYEFYAQLPVASTNSYQKEIYALPNVFLPSVATGASSTTYLGDTCWTAAGWRVANVGGDASYDQRNGAFNLFTHYLSNNSHSWTSARLAYAEN